MIKTLRITSVLMAIAATAFLIFPAVFGADNEKKSKDILPVESAIEKFKKAKGKKATNSKSEIVPLVKEARDFALYLDPPIKKKSVVKRGRGGKMPTVAPRPVDSSVKFTLIATSYHKSDASLSLALIDQPGEGLRWVKQGQKVGHLKIEQIKNGSIVVKGGKKTSELVAERPARISLIKGEAGSKGVSGKAGIVSGDSKPLRRGGKSGKVTSSGRRRRGSKTPPMSEEERQRMFKEMFSELTEGQADDESGRGGASLAER